MESPASRFNVSNIIAACIVAAGLVSAAHIIADRPDTPQHTVAVPPAPPADAVPRLAAPPLSQESVRDQVREQTLASPKIQTFRYNKVVYNLSDVVVSRVSYDAKEDAFLVVLDWVWQPTMPAGGPNHAYVTLSNNGYNQYVGTAILSTTYGGTDQSAILCIK